MKKTIQIFFLLIFFVIGNLHSQDSILLKKIKYRATKRDLSNILVDLSKKSGVNIVFKIVDIPEKMISIYAPDYSIEQILKYVLKETKLKYEVINDQIVIFKPENQIKTDLIINGYITDENTGEKLVYANVYVPNSSKGTVSNNYGFYSIVLLNEDKTLTFSYLGYISKTINITGIEKDAVNVKLKPKPDKQLKEIIIEDSKLRNQRLEFFEQEKVNIERIGKMVHLLGEDDVLRFTHVQPGVLTGADGFGGIHVRGGNTGGNKILLDGVPVYNAQHAVGLFSIFNSSVIKNAKFIKSNFPARYGGGLGSILDIKTRDGNNKKFGGELDVGLLTIKGLFEGPIVDDKSSMLISFRRTFSDIWDKAVSSYLTKDYIKKDISYYFYDFNIKLNFELNSKNRLFFSFYNGKDIFANNIVRLKTLEPDSIISSVNKNQWDWGNSLVSLQWNTQPGKKMFVNTSLFYSSYNLKSHSVDLNLISGSIDDYFFNGRTLDSKINDLGIKFDFDYSLNNNHYLRWGLSIINHVLKPLVFINSSSLKINQLPNASSIRESIDQYNNRSLENRLYFEDKIQIGSSTSLNIGMHVAFYKAVGKNYYSLEPRLLFSHSLNKSMVYSFSITRMSQFVHTLTNNGLGLPSEILLPSTKYLLPEKIWHFNSGIFYEINNKIDLSIEGYYKYANNLIEHKEGSSFIVSDKSNWENYIPGGNGKMYGIETQLRFDTKKIKLWFNYTYSISKRSYEHVDNGKYYD